MGGALWGMGHSSRTSNDEVCLSLLVSWKRAVCG